MFDTSSRFLIVDDSDVARKTVRMALNQLGLTKAEEAANGEVALAKLEQGLENNEAFSLVISDINMPKMTGLELLEACREHKDLEKIPFLMVTTETQKDAVIRAVMKGVSGYIVKPFVVNDLKDKIKETFERVRGNEATAI